MKPADKKPVVVEPVRTPQPKQSSGDKSFDNAIDKMLKKPSTYTQSK
ncbi:MULTISPECIES: hypothetical protein [Mucilaginibacter]|uniref:Uncharacterized protein n=1 Tax=Mucilaginibacter rubeus TaxID=2027860 RepID=A0ABX7U574_9SPHI|nr:MULTISPECIES: hypothetical protein [Mucilaginibacter]QTE41325.1 hypothetical protein J3L19_20505 [Mucilaginibacter rubeus]QTE47929.1 hypothetical protein J3L21_20490 [Mucilaginibacter rubeus]QTE59322.1 hypothetical protein J3L23_12160 [Mucilaginibacter rubeus]QTE61221.1 hypothetical protein J3L22_21695 [Mucilaginibacter rubeus]QTF59979.1 hypothetical protein J3L20_21345 [Mucilaginibacter rubeus]